ncbi:NUDIX hydrolase [Crocosphaera sp. Alani8]|uniref:NUDIX hydrolase n=1 Tax=Crocosphaera sp. Alani8 TaxID=3038952 RepID=UPI00313BCCF9
MGQIWRYIKAIMGIIFRHPITGATIIPVLPDGRIVLIQRKDTGQWGLPGGIVDWGEDLITTARRELKEETGLQLLNVRRLVGVYSSMDRDPRIHSISVLMEAEVRGEFSIEDTLEVMQIEAFLPSDLPLGNLSHDHDRQLNDYLKGLTVLA